MILRSHVLMLILACCPAAWAGSTCNSPPQVSADLVQVGFGSGHLFDPVSNDRDPDGDPLTLVSIANPQTACSGSVSQIGHGLVVFTPTGQVLPGGASACQVTYTVSDGREQRSGTVTLAFPSSVLFADDFESGDTHAWSTIVPGS